MSLNNKAALPPPPAAEERIASSTAAALNGSDSSSSDSDNNSAEEEEESDGGSSSSSSEGEGEEDDNNNTTALDDEEEEQEEDGLSQDDYENPTRPGHRQRADKPSNDRAGGEGGNKTKSKSSGQQKPKKKRASDYPVDCNVCNKTFQSRRSLVRHFRRFHNGKQLILSKPHIPPADAGAVPSPKRVGTDQAATRKQPPKPTTKQQGDGGDGENADEKTKDTPVKPQSRTPAKKTPIAADEEKNSRLKFIKLGELCESALKTICEGERLSVMPKPPAPQVEGIAVFTPLQLRHLGYHPDAVIDLVHDDD